VVDNTISADAKHGREFYVIVINAITNETIRVGEEHALVGYGLLMLASEWDVMVAAIEDGQRMGDIVAN